MSTETDGSYHDPWAGFEDHERVVVAQDPGSGVRMIVAVHSTVLGPALGGTRMATYAATPSPGGAAHSATPSPGGAAHSATPSPGGAAHSATPSPGGAAYADALRLSRAMSYKNALAGLDHGGGKGVILADPAHKDPAVLHAYGRLVESLAGDYVTAGDVGMTVADMDVISDACRWTTGRSPERGGVGDSGILTALGVFRGIQAGARFVFGSDDLAGRRVAVVGAGKVGGRLIGHLAQAGADVVAMDPDPAARDAVHDTSAGVRFVPGLEELLALEPDVLSPNALGGLLTPDLARRLPARLVCGGANNQLADAATGDLLAERGIVYAPDFMVNCGGVIQVAEELVGGDLDRARERTERVYATTLRVLERAAAEGITPVAAAQREAEERIRAGRERSAASAGR